MTTLPVTHSGSSTANTGNISNRAATLAHPTAAGLARTLALFLLAAAVLAAPLLFAQGNPRITSAAPTSGKVDDSVTVTGENLGAKNVTGIYLSDDKDDFKATVVDQGDLKVVIKVPKVKAGNYNLSVQANGNIYIMPVHFAVQE
jgi:hypothetical protein